MDKHGITIYTTYISVDLAHHEVFCAKVGKGGIIPVTRPCSKPHSLSTFMQKYIGATTTLNIQSFHLNSMGLNIVKSISKKFQSGAANATTWT